jgi:hypothetical protein
MYTCVTWHETSNWRLLSENKNVFDIKSRQKRKSKTLWELKCELANAAVPTASMEHPGRTDGARTVPGRRVLSGLTEELKSLVRIVAYATIRTRLFTIYIVKFTSDTQGSFYLERFSWDEVNCRPSSIFCSFVCCVSTNCNTLVVHLKSPRF